MRGLPVRARYPLAARKPKPVLVENQSVNLPLELTTTADEIVAQKHQGEIVKHYANIESSKSDPLENVKKNSRYADI